MGELDENKRILRIWAKERRAALKSPKKDGDIVRHFISSPLTERFQSFFVYRSFDTETATQELIQELLLRGKTVCLPRIEDKQMHSVIFTGNLEKGAYGIMQPAAGEQLTCEVAVVPLLAVDGRGYRLGYGGGFYDRYFAEHPNILRLGLCYFGQVIEGLPHGEHDVPLHGILTECGFTQFPRA